MLTAGIEIFKLLSNRHGLTKIIWLLLEVGMPELLSVGRPAETSHNTRYSPFAQCKDVMEKIKKKSGNEWV